MQRVLRKLFHHHKQTFQCWYFVHFASIFVTFLHQFYDIFIPLFLIFNLANFQPFAIFYKIVKFQQLWHFLPFCAKMNQKCANFLPLSGFMSTFSKFQVWPDKGMQKFCASFTTFFVLVFQQDISYKTIDDLKAFFWQNLKNFSTNFRTLSVNKNCRFHRQLKTF